MKKIVFCVVSLVLLGLAMRLVICVNRERRSSAPAASSVDAASPPRQPGDAVARRFKEVSSESSSEQRYSASPEAVDDLKEDSPKTSGVRREETDESAIDSFDALTDEWMEPSEKGVAIADIDAFVERFRKVPSGRKEECLQRALNLVPDENVMLLAGILMDQSQPKELVELVFNDILNRDEDVKKPILQQVFMDKIHPCWADTAWILDVTGETPEDTKSGR